MVRPKSGVPRGYQAVMPYLRVDDAVSAIKFYKKAFGAKENFRLKMPDGKIGHAELTIGGSVVMLSDAFPDQKIFAPKSAKAAGIHLTTYVENVDKFVAKALKAGATVRRAAADQFYGDRSGQIEDPFGHVWSIQSRIEKVTPKDMQKRLNAELRGDAPDKTGPARKAAKRKPAASAAKPADTTRVARSAAVKSPRRKKTAA